MVRTLKQVPVLAARSFAQSGRFLLVGGMVLGLLSVPLGSATAADLTTKDEANCVNTLNKSGRLVAKNVAGQIQACYKEFVKGGGSPSAESCAGTPASPGDPKGKIGKATTKTGDNYTKKCEAKGVNPPPIGPQDADQVNTNSIQKEFNMFDKIVGSNLDLLPTDKAPSSCVLAIMKGAAKCQDAKVKEFLGCKKTLFKTNVGTGTPTSAGDLRDDCLGTGTNSQPDLKGKIAKKCTDTLKAGIYKDMGKKCVDAGVAIGTVFGNGDCASECGSGGTQCSTCIEEIVECEVCLWANAVDGLDRDCDLFDDGTANSSCGGPPHVCDCCGLGLNKLSFETGIGSGNCGTTANFRCSGGDPDFADSSCATSADCNFGPCIPGPNICTGNFAISCPGGDPDCQGTCGQVGPTNNLVCGGLYTGGGANSVPLPLPVPDQGLSYTAVTGCDSGTGVLTLAASDTGVGQLHCTKGRTCSGAPANTHCVLDSDCPASQTCVDNCLFGPPLPIPNSANTPTSVCAINVPDFDASGTAQCDGGDSDLSLPLRSVIYLTGDLLSTSNPPDVPGIQPCAICSAKCTSDGKPCESNSDCASNDCDLGGGTVCIGGIDNGNACTPGSSGPSVLGSPAYPTSHDCRVAAALDITSNIGGLPIDFGLTTGADSLTAVDYQSGGAVSRRTFCGFCRDINIEGSGCFDGDPDKGPPQGTANCPDSIAQPTCLPASASTAGCGNAIPCTDDSDCTAPYESCSQRSAGAFSNGLLTAINVQGTTDGQCLDDGATHSAKLVSAFCIPPTFDPTVDAAGDLPGPGAALLQGAAQLVP